MSLVVDASVLIRALIQTGSAADAVRTALEREDWHAPELIDLEVASAFRRLTARGALDVETAETALTLLADAPLARYPHSPLLPRVWELRGAVTAYDAAYVALAEALEARLVTSDAKLAASVRSTRARCDIQLLP